MPWQVPVRCTYEPWLKCFKADITIRQGQHFKFTIDEGQHLLTSDRYPVLTDSSGNQVNVFIPKQIRRHAGPQVSSKKRGMQTERRHLAQRRAEKLKASAFDYSWHGPAISTASNN